MKRAKKPQPNVTSSDHDEIIAAAGSANANAANAAYKELIDECIVVAENGFIKVVPPDGGPASFFSAYRLKSPTGAEPADGT